MAPSQVLSCISFREAEIEGGSHPLRSPSGREFSSRPLHSTSMGGRGICGGPTPPTPAPQEARRSDQADCYTDIHLRISTLIGGAECWPHAGYYEAIGSKHTESHIAHGKEVPPGACWIIAPSKLLLHDWESGDGGKLAPVRFPLPLGVFFTTRGTRLYMYVSPCSSPS
jgi:hypothetical protein